AGHDMGREGSGARGAQGSVQRRSSDERSSRAGYDSIKPTRISPRCSSQDGRKATTIASETHRVPTPAGLRAAPHRLDARPSRRIHEELPESHPPILEAVGHRVIRVVID